MRAKRHKEHHKSSRVGWLRASVLGANDGIVSTASLIVGVAAAGSGQSAIVLAGVAGLVAGAMSMAAGEYVSVHSQADAEKADIDVEKEELREEPEAELRELASIYVMRGVEPAIARKVAEQLSAKDALGAHARDELGITEVAEAKPMQAALSSAASFTVGAALPLGVVLLTPLAQLIPAVAAASLAFLALLGALAARAGGANMWKGALRVTFWSAIALAVTAGVGKWVGVSV